jgi:hypothetical protein
MGAQVNLRIKDYRTNNDGGKEHLRMGGLGQHFLLLCLRILQLGPEELYSQKAWVCIGGLRVSEKPGKMLSSRQKMWLSRRALDHLQKDPGSKQGNQHPLPHTQIRKEKENRSPYYLKSDLQQVASPLRPYCSLLTENIGRHGWFSCCHEASPPH